MKKKNISNIYETFSWNVSLFCYETREKWMEKRDRFIYLLTWRLSWLRSIKKQFFFFHLINKTFTSALFVRGINFNYVIDVKSSQTVRYLFTDHIRSYRSVYSYIRNRSRYSNIYRVFVTKYLGRSI